MSDAIKWYPLERVDELEQRLGEIIVEGRRNQQRDALGCCLGLHGLRVGEVCNLKNGDLFRPTRVLNVRTLKGGRDRKIKLDSTLIAELDRWRSAAGCSISPAEPLLPSNRGGKVRRDQFEQFAKATIESLIGEPLTFHALRHTCAMRLYAATRDLFLVQQTLGHSSVKSTEVYARSLAEIPSECVVRINRKAKQ